MTTHLKSRNGSWNLDDLKQSMLLTLYMKFSRQGWTFIRKNGKKVKENHY